MSRRSVQKVHDWLFAKISDSSTPEMRAVYRERLEYLARHGAMLFEGQAPQTHAPSCDERQLELFDGVMS